MESLNVRALVRLLGINENTLRAWERRYGAVSPKRDGDGRRLYSSKDVQRLKLLSSLVQEGHSIGRIAKLKTSSLEKMAAPKSETLPLESAVDSDYLAQIISALDDFRLDRLHETLQRARFQMSPKETIFQLIIPLLQRVGSLVLQNKLSITQEHLLSALLRDYLGVLHQSLSPYSYVSRKKAKNVMLSTREGDMHEFGILLAAILCNLHEYKCYYLGPNMPVRDLLDACAQFKADYLVVSLSSLPRERELITSEKFLGSIEDELPKSTKIFVGGNDSFTVSRKKWSRDIIFLSHLRDFDDYLAQHS